MTVTMTTAVVEEDTTREEKFYISATSQAPRPRQSLKHGDTFIVVDSHGDIGATSGGPDGLFHNDTRFLSRLELLLNGQQPLLLGSNLRDDNTLMSIDLTNPDIYADKHLVLEKDVVHIVRTIFLWRNTAYQRLKISNHGGRSLDLRISILFGNDFADLFEVRGLSRKARGTISRKRAGIDRIALNYVGLDQRTRSTTLIFDPQPRMLTTTEATYEFKLAPGEGCPIFLEIACDAPERPPTPFLRALRSARRELRSATRDMTTVESSNEHFNTMICRSTSDLCMLTTKTPQGPYPYAGIPWYSTTFGRDGIITALQMLWCNPSVAQGVLRRLAAYQATTYNPLADAEPGKILHEMRGGEMARLREVPFELYYGSVDATPLFVLLAGRYLERTGDLQTISKLWPAIEAALRWIDGPADRDGDGFVEYQRATEQGLVNQGWKDSHDAIFHADGRPAEGPIALSEVQGYVFAAKRAAAFCARALQDPKRAAELEKQAEHLAERFEAAFWCPEIEMYALALDGEKKACRVRTSNAGQVLFSGIARSDRAATVTKSLLEARFFSGWGIRTVAKGEARYNPMSYHNGSIWPHDNSLIALGFARYGFKPAVAHVFGGLFDAASYMELHRLPELFCGFQRQRHSGPTLYPVACSPQAWASASVFAFIEASLGLEFDPEKREIRLRNPRLPEFLNTLLLRNLQLGTSSVDLVVHSHAGGVSLEVPRTEGGVQVSVVLSPDGTLKAEGTRPGATS